MNTLDGAIRALPAGDELRAHEVELTRKEAMLLLEVAQAERVARLHEVRVGHTNAAKRRKPKASRRRIT